jgi:hypothetical protein
MTRSSQKKLNYDARITALEEAVSELREQLRSFRDESHEKTLHLKLLQPPKPKRGRKSLIQPFVISDRDELIDMLERFWPELAPMCNKPEPKLLREMLGLLAKAPDRERARAANHLIQSFDVLIEFLRSDRYRQDPRNIANALAGVPKVSWWRSLKHCGGSRRSKEIPRDRAIRDYLHRKHQKIYERLQKADGDVVRITVEMRGIRSRDAIVALLQRNAVYAAQIWKAGEPDYIALRKFRKKKDNEGAQPHSNL